MYNKIIEIEIGKILDAPVVCMDNILCTNMQTINGMQWVDLTKVLSRYRTMIARIFVNLSGTINIELMSTI